MTASTSPTRASRGGTGNLPPRRWQDAVPASSQGRSGSGQGPSRPPSSGRGIARAAVIVSLGNIASRIFKRGHTVKIIFYTLNYISIGIG